MHSRVFTRLRNTRPYVCGTFCPSAVLHLPLLGEGRTRCSFRDAMEIRRRSECAKLRRLVEEASSFPDDEPPAKLIPRFSVGFAPGSWPGQNPSSPRCYGTRNELP